MVEYPSLLYGEKPFSGGFSNIERFNAKDAKFADGLTDKEQNFGDKIQHPYSYPLEFAQQLPAGMQPDGLIE
jgi:hypothetical protein